FNLLLLSRMALDSEAVFRERVDKFGLVDLWPKFEEHGWTTMGSFAFACQVQAGGNPDPEAFQREVLTPLGAAGARSTTAIRRLFWDSWTHSCASMRREIDRREDDPPMSLPAKEIAVRVEAVRKKALPGLNIRDQFEPARATVTTFAQMYEDNQVKYVPWADIPSRADEDAKPAGKKPTEWQEDGQGYVRHAPSRSAASADYGTEFRLYQVLVRRGVAAEAGRVMHLEVHQKIQQRWLAELTGSSPDPAYNPPTLDQVKRADVELWRLLAAPRGGAAASAPGGDRQGDQGSARTRAEKRKESRQRQAENKRQKPAEVAPAAVAPKGAGKGKRTPMPRGLIGKNRQTPDGQPYCFDANLPHGCPHAQAAPLLASAVHEADPEQRNRQRRSPLVPEFSGFADVRLPPEAAFALQVGDVLREPVRHCDGEAPAGAKVLLLGQETGGDHGAEARWVPAKFGLPWHPDEFARAAAGAVAPFDQLPELRSHVLETVFFVLTRALEQDEARLRESMEPGVRHVLRGERLLLLDEMAQAAGYPDCGLAAEAAAGLAVIGAAQRAAVESAGPSPDPALDAEVERVTLEQEAAGLLSAPLVAEVSAALGPDWPPARRFGLWQGGKAREIDDATEFGENLMVERTEKLDVLGLDEVAGLARCWAEAVDWDRRRASVRLPGGAALEGRLSDEWSRAEAARLAGRTLDLSKAYKQLAKRPEHRRYSVVTSWSTSRRRVEFRLAYSLLFGETGAAFRANRFFRPLEWIFCKLFRVAVTNYFDDYPHLEPEVLAAGGHATALEVLRLLGWPPKEERPEDRVPRPVFSALGAHFDMSPLVEHGCFRVGNKPGRIESISKDLAMIEARGRVRRGELESLIGKCQHARSNTFGRRGAAALQALGEFRQTCAAGGRITPRVKWALWWWRRFLSYTRPREVRCHRRLPTLRPFTDGACTPRPGRLPLVSIGAVLCRTGAAPVVWGAEVPGEVVARWQDRGVRTVEQVIGQAELAPAVVARLLWPDVLRQAVLLHWVDNEAARFGLIRGYSPVEASAELISWSQELDMARGTASWVERAPSLGNPADKASRLEFDGYQGAVVLE
ncbi:unnamed protein product, partial [Prorocentrum cordatum]